MQGMSNGLKKAEIGLVPERWDVEPLISFLEKITYGFTNPMPDAMSGPWKITAKDVTDGRINYGTARRTTQEAFDGDLTEKSKPRIGDVLLTKDGSIGRVAVVDRDGVCINQSVALLRPNGRILPDFLKYLLLSPHYQEVMERDSDGSTIKHIYITRVDKMEVAVPPPKEQRSILKILESLDDKIELNRRMIETLEVMARAIFQSWFVDFDPVRAKASGEPAESICHRLSLTPQILASFPDSFEESELGEIPAGWAVRSLDDIASFLNGLALQKYPAEDDWLPVIKIAQLRAGNTLYADRASTEIPSAYIVQDGDVLFSWSGSLEVEIWCGGKGALNQHLFKVTSDEFPRWFYFLWTRHHLLSFRETAANKATTMGHIQRKHLTEAKTICPPLDLLRLMSSAIDPLIQKAISCRLETQKLAGTRDALLPQLLMGSVLVSALEEES
jgi:type I restriction enzyme, S subunit